MIKCPLGDLLVICVSWFSACRCPTAYRWCPFFFHPCPSNILSMPLDIYQLFCGKVETSSRQWQAIFQPQPCELLITFDQWSDDSNQEQKTLGSFRNTRIKKKKKKNILNRSSLSKQPLITPPQKKKKRKKNPNIIKSSKSTGETAARWEWRREAVFRSQTAPALLRGDIQPLSLIWLTHARTHIRARTHTPRRRRRFASCGRAHDMKPVTQTHMWWQSDVPSPSSPRPPLPPQINQRATCTPESLGSGCLNEDIAAMVKDKAEDRTLQYQQTLVSFGWGHRWRLASCVGAWRDFFFFYGCRCRAGEDAAAGCSSASCVRTGGGCVWLLSSILTCCLYWLCFSIFVLLPFLHLDPQVLRHSQPLAWPHLRN